MPEQTINITLHLYDTEIKVPIPVSQEEAWRKAASLINNRMNAYFSRHKGSRPDKEIMYYAIIDIALRAISNDNTEDTTHLEKVIKELTKEIDDALK